MAESNGFRRLIPTIVACIITVLWAISFLLDMTMKDYDPHPSITPIMLAAAGYLFGSEFIGKLAKNGQKPNEEVKP